MLKIKNLEKELRLQKNRNEDLITLKTKYETLVIK